MPHQLLRDPTPWLLQAPLPNVNAVFLLSAKRSRRSQLVKARNSMLVGQVTAAGSSNGAKMDNLTCL